MSDTPITLPDALAAQTAGRPRHMAKLFAPLASVLVAVFAGLVR